jgi:hypothetical protein
MRQGRGAVASMAAASGSHLSAHPGEGREQGAFHRRRSEPGGRRNAPDLHPDEPD